MQLVLCRLGIDTIVANGSFVEYTASVHFRSIMSCIDCYERYHIFLYVAPVFCEGLLHRYILNRNWFISCIYKINIVHFGDGCNNLY